MTTEIATAATTTLAIADNQAEFTEVQIAGLKQLGVDSATRGDLDVFFHTAKRLGLDPFQKQIYMVGRKTKVGGYNGDAERWETKYTIQVGIDGFRVTGHRVAQREGLARPVAHRQFCGRDGIWRDVLIEDGAPVAAKCVITCGGEVVGEAVVKFAEYVQTQRNGNPTQMWADKPATMLGKCAEAAAWRSAFPQDFSQVYEPAEFHEVIDGEAEPVRVRSERGRGVAALREAAESAKASPDAQAPDTSGTRRKWLNSMDRLFKQADVNDPGDRQTIMAALTDGRKTENNELTDADLVLVVNTLNAWAKGGDTETQVREILNAAALSEANETEEN